MKQPTLTRDGDKFLVFDNTGKYRAKTFREARNVLHFITVNRQTVNYYLWRYCQ